MGRINPTHILPFFCFCFFGGGANSERFHCIVLRTKPGQLLPFAKQMDEEIKGGFTTKAQDLKELQNRAILLVKSKTLYDRDRIDWFLLI